MMLKRCRGILLAASILAPLPLYALHDAEAAARTAGGVYCARERGYTKILAARVIRDGSLRFGISIWDYRGFNVGVFGLAKRRGGGWEYAHALNAADAGERCRLTIAIRSGGEIRVDADPGAPCRNMGGYGTNIGSVTFYPRMREGPVTSQLQDAEAFQRAGRCALLPVIGARRATR
jgi:hypothetical protein